MPVDFLLTAVLGGLQSLAGSAVGNVPYVERDGRLRLVGQFQRAADYLLRSGWPEFAEHHPVDRLAVAVAGEVGIDRRALLIFDDDHADLLGQ